MLLVLLSRLIKLICKILFSGNVPADVDTKIKNKKLKHIVHFRYETLPVCEILLKLPPFLFIYTEITELDQVHFI